VAFAARLSKRFYDRLGEDLVIELVELLNQMASDSRADLRDLTDMTVERFDARLQQRAAELDAKIDQRASEIRGELRVLGGSLEQRLAEQTALIEKRLGEQSATIYRALQDQNRMLIGAWGVLMASMVALWFK